MLLVKDPGQFQVIVTNNLFGDIVTDLGAALQGGLGMAASRQHPSGPDVAVRAGARLGAAARGEGRRQPDGRDPVGGADARDARPDGRSAARSSRRSKRPCTPARPPRTSAARSARAGGRLRSPRPSPRRTTSEGSRHHASNDVFILGGARTPMTQYVGRAQGRRRPSSSGAIAARRRRWRAPASRPTWIDHVVFGNVLQTQRRRASTARGTSGSRPACRSRCRR